MNKILTTCVSAVLFLALSAGSVHARGPRNLTYAYGNTLELQVGWAGVPYSAGGATALSSGAAWDIRYTNYFSRHWGVYAQLGTATASSTEDSFFKALDKAEGCKYAYATHDNNSFYGSLPDNDFSVLFSVGAAYRYDFGGWSLRPRMGIGVGKYRPSAADYVRYERGGDVPQYFSIIPSGRENEKEYLYDEWCNLRHSYNGITGLTLSPSLQLTYTLRRHFFFSVEAGADLMTSKVGYIKRHYETVSAYNPQTWADAINQAELKGLYKCDTAHYSDVRFTQNLASMVSVKFGLGWNIGWNRNERGWYGRK